MTPHSRPWIDQSIRTLRREVRGEKMGGGGGSSLHWTAFMAGQIGRGLEFALFSLLTCFI